MENTQFSKFLAQSIRYLVIFAGGILAIILFVIYPYQKSISALDKEIKKIQTQIQEQEMLVPVYKGLLKETKLEGPSGISCPEKATLDRDRIDRISLILKEKAQQNNLELRYVVPDVESFTKGSGLLSVNTQLKGNFFDFRKFLIHVGKIPFLERIAEIRITPVGGAKEFGLTMLFALKKH